MPTTDKNGVVQITADDPIAPIQSLINSVSGSISGVLSDLRRSIVHKATSQANANTKKNKLASQGIVGTPDDPLLFYFTDINTMYEWDGSSWNQIAPEPNTIVVDGVRYVACGRQSLSFNLSASLGRLYYGYSRLSLPSAAPPGYQHAISIADGGGSEIWVSRVAQATSAEPNIAMLSTKPQSNRTVLVSWSLQSR